MTTDNPVYRIGRTVSEAIPTMIIASDRGIADRTESLARVATSAHGVAREINVNNKAVPVENRTKSEDTPRPLSFTGQYHAQAITRMNAKSKPTGKGS
jgi:hypothetical protein